jgi:hypothetical protein
MPASADIYRCDTARGPLFQDHACDRGSVVAVDDRPTSAGKGLRDSELRWLRQREVRARRKTPRPAHKRRHSDKAQQRRCWNKKARLEKVRAHLRRGYKPTQGERLRRQRRQLEDYLSRFCDS